MRIPILFFLILVFSPFSEGQYLHMPAEIDLILKESERTYVFDTLKKEITLKEHLATKEFAKVKIPDSIQLEIASDYETSPDYEKYRIKAQKFAEKEKIDKAIEHYLLALDAIKVEDKWTTAMTLLDIGNCFLDQGDYENAVIWFEKGLKTNVVPARFYRILAEAHAMAAEKSKAIEFITKAYLFEATDSTTLEKLDEFYASNGLIRQDWDILPQYQLSKDRSGAVRIASKTLPWKAYAACKAVWQNEPGYAEDMKNLSTENLIRIEEKECLLNALIAWEKMEAGKNRFPALETLARALPARMVDTYLLYETGLKYQPELVFTLTAEEVDRVTEYLIGIRAQKASAEQ